MTTLAELKTAVARTLDDPEGNTFNSDDLGDFISTALAEVGRVAPRQFQEDIAVVADTLEYTPLFDTFGVALPELELHRVEVWDGSKTPPEFFRWLQPASAEHVNTSAAGWTLFGGILAITNATEKWLDPDTHLIRVWGYAPYAPLVAADDVLSTSHELELAVRDYCRIPAYRRLSNDRALFTQWQVRSNNTDISPAGLMNLLNQAQDDWRRTKRELTVIREKP